MVTFGFLPSWLVMHLQADSSQVLSQSFLRSSSCGVMHWSVMCIPSSLSVLAKNLSPQNVQGQPLKAESAENTKLLSEVVGTGVGSG